jgi:hypothetical protein
MAQTEGASPVAAPALPLFYRKPIVLSAAHHFGLSYAPIGNYRFARASNSIPLTVGEFVPAVRHYPIVFSGTAPALPVAIVGIDDDDNLFVDAGGRWAEGAYVPAYVRRYPFIFVERDDKKDYMLAIDEAAGTLEAGDGNPVFRDGQPSETIRQALAFCGEYQANVNATRAFCDALEAESLLVPKEADFTLATGRRVRLTGFRVIDEARFDKLPGKTFLHFRKRGWLHPIYLQLVATANWAGVIDRAATRGL